MSPEEPVLRTIREYLVDKENDSVSIIPTETLEWLLQLSSVPIAEIPHIRLDFIPDDRQD